MLSSTILSLFSILLTFATAEDGAKLIGHGMKCTHTNEAHHAYFNRSHIFDVLHEGCVRYLNSQKRGLKVWAKKVAFHRRTVPVPFQPEDYGLKITQTGPFLIWRISPDNEPDVKNKFFIVLSYRPNSQRPCDFAAIVTKQLELYYKCERMEVHHVQTGIVADSFGSKHDSSSGTDSSRRSGEGSTNQSRASRLRSPSPQSGGSTSRPPVYRSSGEDSNAGSSHRSESGSSRPRTPPPKTPYPREKPKLESSAFGSFFYADDP